jgi:hypothetical protein
MDIEELEIKEKEQIENNFAKLNKHLRRQLVILFSTDISMKERLDKYAERYTKLYNGKKKYTNHFDIMKDLFFDK